MPCRHRSIGKIVLRHEQQIDFTCQLEMLKPVVEQMDRGAEPALGERARQIAIGADEHGDAGKRAREHQRLVAGRVEIGDDARAVGDDRDAVARDAPRVAVREDGGPLAAVLQHARQIVDHRRLAAAADAQVADADDGAGQTFLPRGIARVPRPPPRGGRAVHRAEGSDQCTRRKGRTRLSPWPSPGGSSSPMTSSVLVFAPRFASTRARAAAPRRARRTGSVTRVSSTSSSS